MIQKDLNYAFFTLSFVLFFSRQTNQLTMDNSSVSQYFLKINNSNYENSKIGITIPTNKILQRRVCYFANWVIDKDLNELFMTYKLLYFKFKGTL